MGLYPISLAYNCAMQTADPQLLLAPRPGRSLLGAFPKNDIAGMDPDHLATVEAMGSHLEGSERVPNTLEDLIRRCELVVISSNSNHVEDDLQEAIAMREALQREHVVLACLADPSPTIRSPMRPMSSAIRPNLAFFPGFHRHGALRNPLDSFTANFCHPDALSALLGARMLDRLSRIFRCHRGYTTSRGNTSRPPKTWPRSLRALATPSIPKPRCSAHPADALLEQCLDQAATVSIARRDRQRLYYRQAIALTELGYGVQRIEAALVRDGDMERCVTTPSPSSPRWWLMCAAA